MKRRSLSVTALLAAAIFAIAGCARYRFVYLRYDLYVPDPAGIPERYAGKAIVLDNIHNFAEDTVIHGYYSFDHRIFYDTSMITSYFWYGLEKAFTAGGLEVYASDSEPRPIPTLQIVLRSISDTRFQFSAQLQRSEGAPFMKNFEVSQPPPAYEKLNDIQMEALSYRMITQMAAAILEDPDFQKAFFGDEGDAETNRPI